MSEEPDPQYRALLARFEQLIATQSGIDRKGTKMPYTSLNGHMFSFLDSEGHLSLRLPDSERDSFLARHDTRLSEQHGRVMKEYVLVPDELLQGESPELKAAFETSVIYIRSLKPKPTKRKPTPA